MEALRFASLSACVVYGKANLEVFVVVQEQKKALNDVAEARSCLSTELASAKVTADGRLEEYTSQLRTQLRHVHSWTPPTPPPLPAQRTVPPPLLATKACTCVCGERMTAKEKAMLWYESTLLYRRGLLKGMSRNAHLVWHINSWIHTSRTTVFGLRYAHMIRTQVLARWFMQMLMSLTSQCVLWELGTGASSLSNIVQAASCGQGQLYQARNVSLKVLIWVDGGCRPLPTDL